MLLLKMRPAGWYSAIALTCRQDRAQERRVEVRQHSVVIDVDERPHKLYDGKVDERQALVYGKVYSTRAIVSTGHTTRTTAASPAA